ncbi:MAG TPA: response regulator transcription factor [Ktedonobacterales bacterium]|nr:response regulator transcription factor [Ktedonobacterales bacterium]
MFDNVARQLVDGDTGTETRRRILVVDDEGSIREVLVHYLEAAGFAAMEAPDGATALRAAASFPPDLVILDVMLPGIDGMEVCRRLRAESAMPILMLTARTEEEDKLAGFGIGADDYVTKPFSPREVVVRVQALLRRVEALSVPAMVLDDTVRVGDLVVRPQLRQAEREGISLDLTAKEFDLLRFLTEHPRQVFSRQQLLDQVWDIGYYGDPSTVTVHICRLREKLEVDPTHPRHLRTVWGVGYKFEP